MALMAYEPINLSWLGYSKPQLFQNYPMSVNAPSTIDLGTLDEAIRHNREVEKGAAAQRALYSRQLGIKKAADEALDRYRQGKLAEEERREQQALFNELGKATARQDWPRVLAIGEEINRRGYGQFETGPGFGAQEEGQGQRLLTEPMQQNGVPPEGKAPIQEMLDWTGAYGVGGPRPKSPPPWATPGAPESIARGAPRKPNLDLAAELAFGKGQPVPEDVGAQATGRPPAAAAPQAPTAPTQQAQPAPPAAPPPLSGLGKPAIPVAGSQQGLGRRPSFRVTDPRTGRTMVTDNEQAVAEWQGAAIAEAFVGIVANAKTPEEQEAVREGIEVAVGSARAQPVDEAIQEGIKAYENAMQRIAAEKRARIAAAAAASRQRPEEKLKDPSEWSIKRLQQIRMAQKTPQLNEQHRALTATLRDLLRGDNLAKANAIKQLIRQVDNRITNEDYRIAAESNGLLGFVDRYRQWFMSNAPVSSEIVREATAELTARLKQTTDILQDAAQQVYDGTVATTGRRAGTDEEWAAEGEINARVIFPEWISAKKEKGSVGRRESGGGGGNAAPKGGKKLPSSALRF